MSARSDFFTLQENLLLNPKWPIRPSILFTKDGPVLMTCRNHDNGTNKRYIHPPLHPCSNLPNDDADQLAPAVLRPRTIKSMKPSKYSNGYQMCQMKGNFEGLDTIFLTNVHQFDKESRLRFEQESIILKYRSDVKGMFCKWKEEGKILSRKDGETRLWQAHNFKSFYDNDMVLSGSTFVTLKDALKLQKLIKLDSGSLLQITDPTGNVKHVHFKGRWPKIITHVHPSINMNHGAEFPTLPNMYQKDTDTRLLFFTVAVHVCIPDIWEKIDCSVTSINEWKGWLLAYAGRFCFDTNSYCRGRKNWFCIQNDVKCKIQEKLTIAAGLTPDSPFRNGSEFRQLFDGIQGIQVVQNSLNCNNLVLQQYNNKVIVVYRNPFESDDEIFLEEKIDINGHEWELRFISTSSSGINVSNWKGVVYARHGGNIFSKWWKKSRSRQRINNSCFCMVESIDIVDKNMWEIGIYVRCNQADFDIIRNDFLSLLGGQTKAHCLYHKTPLIVSPIRHKKNCCEEDCAIKASYECPINDCTTCICKTHHKQIPSMEQKFFSKKDSNNNSLNFDDSIIVKNDEYENENDDDYNEENDDESHDSSSLSNDSIIIDDNENDEQNDNESHNSFTSFEDDELSVSDNSVDVDSVEDNNDELSFVLRTQI